MSNWNKIIGGALLIAGTTVGAGMLALPIVTATSGFYPMLAVFVLAWLFMLASGLLVLEANLWFSDRINLLSMTRATLGFSGYGIALAMFLLLLYSVNAAYITGAASLLSVALDQWLPHHSLLATLLVLVMGAIVFFGTRTVDYTNRILMTGLVLSYLILIGFIAPNVDIFHYTQGDPRYLPGTWIIVVLSFAYQFVIPGIRSYIGSNFKHLAAAIFIGSIIPLILYIIWTGAILGSIPLEGEHGLLALREGGEPVGGLSNSLNVALNVTWVGQAVGMFSLCALITSILGVSWSMVGLLYDITKVEGYNAARHLGFVLITFIPPLLFALFFQKGFEVALRYAGIFVAVLLGLMPPMMVWAGRYKKNLAKPGDFRVFGGKTTLGVVIMLSTLLIILEIAQLYGWLE
ncbi:MAG: amino acid permease [Gammaproteobacteria bacterium]